MPNKNEEKPNAEKAENDSGAGTGPKAELQDTLAVVDHEIIIKGVALHYTTTTGTFVIKDEAGKAKSTIFFIAYTKKDVPDESTRPLTISFNGGPGSSSVWLHLGLLGPRRVQSGDVGNMQPPPYRLLDNEFTLLTVSDLVFIDPVSTGFSRPAPGEEAKQFHGLENDIESVGDFIRLYVTRYKRWRSPKFLVGESYGTTRAAGLSGYLQNRHGMYLNGLMLISSILNFQTARFNLGNDLPYILFLPTYAATAHYHGQVGDEYKADLQGFLAEVTTFAAGEYTLALMQGDRLAGEARAQIIAKLARYTGLSATYIERTNLRINIHRFCKELLRAQRRTVGRIDARFQGIDRDASGEDFEHDPSMTAIMGPYTGAFNDYVRRELAFENDLPYEIMTSLYQTWSYDKHQNQYVNVAETLREAMSKNPALKVIVANGYYDLATPYFATEYTFNHLELDPTLRDNIAMTYYEAGHMMYIHEASLTQLAEDLRSFVHDSIPT
jgi:carboxypeptidase C (cathepsin A)